MIIFKTPLIISKHEVSLCKPKAPIVEFFPKHRPIEQSSPKLQIHDKISWIDFSKNQILVYFCDNNKKQPKTEVHTSLKCIYKSKIKRNNLL